MKVKINKKVSNGNQDVTSNFSFLFDSFDVVYVPVFVSLRKVAETFGKIKGSNGTLSPVKESIHIT